MKKNCPGNCTAEVLCAACARKVANDLDRLPGLHDACGAVLAGLGNSTGRERTSGGPLPSGITLDTRATEARASIIAFLSSWSALVADERPAAAPARAVTEMIDFLLEHLHWLARHPSAHEFRDEADALVRRALRASSPDTGTRSTDALGPCVHRECSGTLRGVAGANEDAPELRCDRDVRHRWSAADWVGGGLRTAAAETPAGARGGAAANESWLSAKDISRIWRVPTGTVYRLASEQGWNRRKRPGGGTLYRGSDAAGWFRSRTVRGRSD